MDKLWERQKNESEKAFEAFKIYRDMGQKRTVSAVVEKLGKSRSLIDRWKEQWNWKERVRAYDNELEKQAKEKAIKDYKAMTEQHIKIAVKLQKKALKAFDNLKIEEMSPKDIKEFIKMATDLERLSRTIGNDTQEENTVSNDNFIDALKQETEHLDWGDINDKK